MDMTPKLNAELSNALQISEGELEVIDPATNRTYVVVEQAVLARAKAVLERQEQEDLAAVKRGLQDVEAGRTMPLDEAFDSIRQQFDAHQNR